MPPPDNNIIFDVAPVNLCTFDAFEFTAPLPPFFIVIDLFVFKEAVGNVTVTVLVLSMCKK